MSCGPNMFLRRVVCMLWFPALFLLLNLLSLCWLLGWTLDGRLAKVIVDRPLDSSGSSRGGCALGRRLGCSDVLGGWEIGCD